MSMSRRQFVKVFGLSAATLGALGVAGCSDGTSGSGSSAGSDGSKIQTIKDRGVLNCGVKADVIGYGYMDTATQEYEGLEIDLCYQIAAAVFEVSYEEAREQDLCAFTTVTPTTRGTLIDSGQLDIVAATYTITPEREEEVDFTDPYAMAQLAILAGADSGVEQAEDLNQADKTVAVKTGSTGDVYATKNLANAQILRLADESACVTEVAQGRADGFLYDQLTIYRNNLANPDTTRAVFIPFQDPEAWGIAVASGNDELREELNAFIAESKENGEFDRLTEQYLADEKAAFDELGFRWFFDFDDADAEGVAASDADAEGAAEADA